MVAADRLLIDVAMAHDPHDTLLDDEPDEWDQRILKTGCYEENLALQLCHADEGDWRKCLGEMETFRKCWDQHKNNERTLTVDNAPE